MTDSLLETPRLSDLPGNLLAQIASHLDRSSAIALACTNSILQPHGECRAWRNLNMSVHQRYQTPNCSPTWHQLLGGKRLLVARHAVSWENDGLLTSSSTIVAEYIDELSNTLKQHPSWLLSVRELAYDLDYDLVPGFIDLLRLLRPTLTALRFFAPDVLLSQWRNRRYTTLETLFDRMASPFSSLQSLQFPIGDQWDTRVRIVLCYTPALRSLRLTAAEQYSNGWSRRSPILPASKRGDWPVLPLLRTLEIDQMSEHYVEMVAELVRGGAIRHVALRDPARQWTKCHDVLYELDAALDYLAVTSDCRDALSHFTALDRLSYMDRDMRELPGLTNIDIPALPNLRILYASGAMFHGDDTIIWPWIRGAYHLPAPIYPILPAELRRLHGAPRLELIQFTSFPENERNPITADDWDYWGSKEAFENHERAILIRTYTNVDSEEVFTHCRAYSAHRIGIQEDLLYRVENVWDQYTDYRGRVVPPHILIKVYEAMQESVVWLVPGRGLKMAEKGWEVLREEWQKESNDLGATDEDSAA